MNSSTELFKLTQAFIYFEIINDKKKIKGMLYKDSSKNWTLEQAKKNMQMSQFNGAVCVGPARVIKLQGSGIVCVDIDEKDKTYDEVITAYPCLEGQCYVKGNTKGFHFYVKTDNVPKSDKIDVLSEMLGDIIVNQMFEVEGKEWTNTISNMDLSKVYEPKTDTESVSDVSETESIKSTISEKTKTTDKYIDLLFNVIKNEVKPEKVITRVLWFQICSILKHNGYDKSIWLKYSGLVSQTQTACKQWDRLKDAPMSIYGLQSIAKKINPTGYKEWLQKYNIYYISLEDLNDSFRTAEIITSTLKNRLVLCKEEWYMLDKRNLWKKQKEPSFYIIEELRKYIDFSQLKTAHKISTTEGDEKDKYIKINKEYLSSYSTMNTSSKLSPLKAFLRTTLYDDKFIEKLDTIPHVMAFENGIMDLKTRLFREGIQPDDFITETIPYPYQPSSKKKRIELDEVFKKIMNNNDEHAEYFKRVLGHSMTGCPNLEKSMYFCVDKTDEGKGDNGKTLIFDILTSLLPNYVYKTKAVLLEEGNKKVHKQLVLCKGKRLVWMDEFGKTKTDAELMKVCADGLTIENEVMFGTSECIKIMFKMFILTNSLPDLNGKETACYNRYKQISFNSHFDRFGIRKQEEPEKLLFIADTTLGDRIKNEYVNEIMDLLIEYGNKYYVDGIKTIPIQFQTDAKETKQSNDALKNWIDDNCKLTGRIALKQISIKMNEKEIKDGMKRLGFKYDKDLSKIGKDTSGKAYKGGYDGISLIEETEDDVGEQKHK
jgi:phage/plasmid-associated DNA primase